MIFRTLKMAGFKSFAEVAEVEIESGLTGIVGPNGCGKSNVVEGLRWVMGESSARQIRGGEMDDVIFAGTDQRPARNLAEITLKLDNSKRNAPAEFNNDDELEITRKIERGKGSSYYVNAKPARARDVQLLFADTATGARSSGIVSQGRIGAIVGAKPVDRRALLEEAANIRGLHARRHEAELRLRGAETNLERLDDVIAGLIEQRDSLKKQARQAARYRSVADRIRQAEAQLLFARWTSAQNDLANAEADLNQAKLLVATRTEEAANIATTRSELAAQLPPLRDAEAARAAEYQRLAIGHDELDREEARLKDALSQLEARQAQINADVTRENGLREDANVAIEALASETETLQQQIDEAAPRREAAHGELETARASANTAEAALADASALLRSAATSRNGLTTRLNDLLARREKASRNLADLSLDTLGAQTKVSSAGLVEAEADFTNARNRLEKVEATLGDAQTLADTTKADERETEAQITRIQAEIDALEYLLADSGDNEDTPIVDQLSVEEGMETALAAYLADELTAPADAGTHSYWRDGMAHGDLTPPEGTLPLGDFVSGSNALCRALAGVGVVEDEATAESIQPTLCPGQAVTTKSGHLWRWDGFVRHASQNDRSAERIRQRRRLEALETDAVKAGNNAKKMAEKTATAQQALDANRTAVQDARQASIASEQHFGEARRHAESDALKLAAGEERATELATTLDTLVADIKVCETQLAELGNETMLAEQETTCRNTAEQARQALSEAMQADSRLEEILRTAGERLAASSAEQTAWQGRLDGAASRVAELETRFESGKLEQQRLEQMPADIEKRRLEMGDRLEAAGEARQEASDLLVKAENQLGEVETAQRIAEGALGEARETQIRVEGAQERGRALLQDIKDRIHEKLDCTPDQIADIANVESADTLPPVATLDDKVQRLLRERDNIGPVNLRAEVEMEDVASRIASMEAESEDLLAAIAKLRAAISQLNREGRERLLTSFAEVNGHFKELFKKLFGGGTAELQLTEADDPLEAGLEIMASPPGKRLQSLSLLSGGEQALTALAIIFAVFLTNPAPICVLDEVDAPLDDSNVARFCDLLRDIVGKTDTRFLIITHHRMTMARMDRLFGITMEQRGLSKLVSVDLQAAERMRDSAIA